MLYIYTANENKFDNVYCMCMILLRMRTIRITGIAGSSGGCLPLSPSARRPKRITKKGRTSQPLKTLLIHPVRLFAFVQALKIRPPVTWCGLPMLRTVSIRKAPRRRLIFRMFNVLLTSCRGSIPRPPALRLMTS